MLCKLKDDECATGLWTSLYLFSFIFSRFSKCYSRRSSHHVINVNISPVLESLLTFPLNMALNSTGSWVATPIEQRLPVNVQGNRISQCYQYGNRNTECPGDLISSSLVSTADWFTIQSQFIPGFIRKIYSDQNVTSSSVPLVVQHCHSLKWVLGHATGVHSCTPTFS